MAIVYLGCTDGRGFSTTVEVSGAAGGTFKVVADASIEAAVKLSKQESTPVALEIVNDCMELAKASVAPADTERAALAESQRKVQEELAAWRAKVDATPLITASRNSGKSGDKVTVNGVSFGPDEMIDLKFHTRTLAQIRADNKGAFTAVVTIPEMGVPNFATDIWARGLTSNKSARTPFTYGS